MAELNVLGKLQKARVKVNTSPLQKSGENSYVKYKYFELSDFMPTITNVCNEIGLCCVPSFKAEGATLTVYDTATGENIVFESPVVTIEMKGCNEVQCLGSVQTYIRRYLYMSAFEITENDTSEALTGTDAMNVPPKKATVPQKSSTTAKPTQQKGTSKNLEQKDDANSRENLENAVVKLIGSLKSKPELGVKFSEYYKSLNITNIKEETDEKLGLLIKWFKDNK